MTPENRPSQKESNLPTIHFEGYVSFREGNNLQAASLHDPTKNHLSKNLEFLFGDAVAGENPTLGMVP